MMASTFVCAKLAAKQHRLQIAGLIRRLRAARRVSAGMAVVAYTEDRGVLVGVERPGVALERAIEDVIAERESWREAGAVPPSMLMPVYLQPYDPEAYRAPMPPDKGQRRFPNGILSNLGSSLVVPRPVGVAAVYVADKRTSFAAAGRTPGLARLLRAVVPRLAEAIGVRGGKWYRAPVRLEELVDQQEGGPLAPFFVDAAEEAMPPGHEPIAQE